MVIEGRGVGHHGEAACLHRLGSGRRLAALGVKAHGVIDRLLVPSHRHRGHVLGHQVQREI